MTNAEIMKALECCAVMYDCPDCPFECDCGSMGNLSSAAIDLINRQRAQIEKLEKVEHFATKTIDRLQVDIKEFNDKFNSLVASNVYLINRVDKTKTEAIKEFAERLKKSAFECDVSFGYGKEHNTKAVTVIEIDNLVKEMAGKERKETT